MKNVLDMTPAEYQAARGQLIRQGREAAPTARAEPAANLTPKDRIEAELKSLATGAGLVDLDWLKLADLSTVRVNEGGEVEGATELLDALRQAKPYLFGAVSTSGTHRAPDPRVLTGRGAVDDTPEQYAARKAAALRR